MKEGLNGKPTKVTANPSTFIQHKVNFVENIFYGESTPTGEYPIVRIPGHSLISRIPGGSHPRRKKQYPWFEGSFGQKKDRRRKANILLLKIPEKLMDMKRKA